MLLLGKYLDFSDASETVLCSSVIDHSFNTENNYTTCFVDLRIPASVNYKLGRVLDNNLTAVYFQKNKDLKYLPQKVSELFPNLEVYDASHCAIAEIAKSNFEGLTSLELLWLGNNSIEVIREDVFEDLRSLVQLHLGETLKGAEKM